MYIHILSICYIIVLCTPAYFISHYSLLLFSYFSHLSSLSGAELQELVDGGWVSRQYALYLDHSMSSTASTKLAPGQSDSVVCVHLLPPGCGGHPTQLPPVLREGQGGRKGWSEHLPHTHTVQLASYPGRGGTRLTVQYDI